MGIRNGKEFLTPRRMTTFIGMAAIFVLGILFANGLVRCLGPG